LRDGLGTLLVFVLGGDEIGAAYEALER